MYKWIFSILLLFSSFAFAEEEILDYQVSIKVQEDSSLKITEHIKVRAEKKQIKRGIYRDFPIVSNHYKFFRKNHRLENLSIMRDGVEEFFHINKLGSGVSRVYIGSKNKFLNTGVYTYKLSYTFSGHIVEHNDNALINYNVLPHYFSFPIKKADVYITLPNAYKDSEVLVDAYTGAWGSSNKNVKIQKNGNLIHLKLTRSLPLRAGMTAYLSFPVKDISITSTFLSDNFDILALLFILLGGIYYSYICWDRYGRDPKTKVVVPHYEAPHVSDTNRLLNPLEVNAIKDFSYFSPNISALLVSLATKKVLEVERIEDKLKGDSYKVTKLENTDLNLDPYELILCNTLFKSHATIYTSSTIVKKNFRKLSAKLSKMLKKNLKKKYLISNNKIRIKLSLYTILPASIIFVLSMMMFPGARIFKWILYVSIILTYIIFFITIKKYTRSGMRVKEDVDGYLMYLKTAEEPILRKSDDTNYLEEVFEKHLPYAIALGVAKQWNNKFLSYVKDNNLNNNYVPSWYSGGNDTGLFGGSSEGFDPASFASSFSASSMPSSSGSSSSGGGFSGGGSGGGGGGGW